MPAPDPRPAIVLDRAGLDRLVELLIAEGYRVIGPTLRDGAIVLGELDSAAAAARGMGSGNRPRALPGAPPGRRGRLRALSRPAVLEAVPAPAAAPALVLTSPEGGFTAPEPDSPRYAFLGVRGCDLAAISILGNVLGGGQHPDGAFARIRRGLFVIAANCTEPGGVCFCASMGTGPAAGPGYDIALTEQTGEPGHRFVAEPAPPRAPASWPRSRTVTRGPGSSRRPGPRSPRRSTGWAGRCRRWTCPR